MWGKGKKTRKNGPKQKLLRTFCTTKVLIYSNTSINHLCFLSLGSFHEFTDFLKMIFIKTKNNLWHMCKDFKPFIIYWLCFTVILMFGHTNLENLWVDKRKYPCMYYLGIKWIPISWSRVTERYVIVTFYVVLFFREQKDANKWPRNWCISWSLVIALLACLSQSVKFISEGALKHFSKGVEWLLIK